MPDSRKSGTKKLNDRSEPPVELPAGSNLFGPDLPLRKLLLLKSGVVQLSTNQKAIIEHLGPGDIFGEHVFLPKATTDRSAKALTPVKVVTLTRTQLLDRVQSDRRFALQLFRGLAERLDRYEQLITDFIADHAEIRLARLLARIARRRRSSGWVRLPYPFSNRALAKAVGTTRWRISLFMRKFREHGWLRSENGLWVHREWLADFLDASKSKSTRVA